MQAIIISPKAYQEILNFLRQNAPQKIAAIKTLRNASEEFLAERLGLREAKYAIERLQHELGHAKYPHAALDGMTIISGPRIKSMIVNFGDGDVEVDIEAMQMKILSQLHVIGLDSCAHILELVHVIKAFSEGHKVGIIKEKDNS